MKMQFFALSLFLGVVLSVHLAMNGEVMKKMENARVANAVFWCIGAMTALVLGVTGWKSGALGSLKQINLVLLTAGMMGACLVFAIGWMVPRVGMGNLMVTLLAGQVITGLVLSHYGWLGSAREPVTAIKIVGAVVMLGGAVLATLQFGKQG